MKALADDPIRVLHVDDNVDFLEVAAEFLATEDERIEVTTAVDAESGLAELTDGDVDCIVSDFDIPGENGIEFLETVREDVPELPFILFTGKGSEEVAGDAISAGVTDYLQKHRSPDQYTVLANRIINAVERARVERERTRHLNAIETAQEGIGILDADRNFIYVNASFATLYEYEPEDLVGESWKIIYREADVPEIRDDVHPYVEETGHWHGTITGERADGSTFVVDQILSQTAADEFVCTVRDITARREQETRLDVLARRYEAVFENPLSLIALLNTDGLVLEVNPTAMEVVEADIDDVLGTHFWETPWWSHDAELQADLQDWIDRAGAGEPVRFESTHPTRDGETATVDGLFHPIFDDTETVTELLVIGRDVSDRKRREEELRRERDRLEEFTSVVSHDLRTPLTVASGRLTLAKEDCESEHMDAIEQAHKRIEELLEDLLTLARSGNPITDVESLSLRDVAKTSWATVATEKASLSVECDGVITGDRSRFKQLLENIFRNAVEHGGEHVTVEIGQWDDRDGFYIADDGPGIPETDRDRIFDAGYTNAAEGTGLGLRIVEQIAQTHGWEVSVTASSTGGAQFEFTNLEIEDPALTDT